MGFEKKISMKLCYQYMTIFLNLSPTSSHLHPLQVENCDSNSRLVVDEDDNGKFRPERVNLKWKRPTIGVIVPEWCYPCHVEIRYTCIIMMRLYLMHTIKLEELHILSCENRRGRRPRPFSQLRM